MKSISCMWKPVLHHAPCETKKPAQSTTEYAIPLALIVMVAISILFLIGTNVSILFSGAISVRSPAPSAQSLTGTTGTTSAV